MRGEAGRMHHGPMEELRLDPGNRPALAEWDGELGQHWARHAAQFEAGLRRYVGPWFEAAGIGDHERVLDVGCGAGQSTIEAARRAPSGSAVGIDLSRPLLEVARGRAAGMPNVRFIHGDAQVHRFDPGEFDVALSRNGTVFFADGPAAFANIAAGVRPGGRLALLVWGPIDDNPWLTTVNRIVAAGRHLPGPPPGAPGPFSMSDPDKVTSLLSGSGWRDVRLDLLAEPLYFGPDVDAAWSLLRGGLGWALEDLDETQRAEVAAELHQELAARTSDDGVQYPSAMWLVSAARA